MTHGLRHWREQRPVGQGFFHVGCVRAVSRSEGLWPRCDAMKVGDLFYIYDCGAMPRYAFLRGREVRELRQHASGKRLDFLFLSHFHADHVNGVPALLAKRLGLQVDTIVMPLIEDTERLIVFARALDTGAAKEAGGFYRDFVIDPVRAIMRFAPRQIVLVRRSGPRGDGAPDGGEPIGPEGGDLPDDGRGGLDGEEALRWRLVGRGGIDRRNDASGRATILKPIVYEIDDTIAIRIAASAGPAWILAPYIDPAFRQRTDFLRALASELDMTPRAVNAAVSNIECRRDWVIEKTKELRKAYSVIAKDLNLTSMSLLSGPVRGHVVGIGWGHRSSGAWWPHELYPPNDRASWLGTGDADLARAVRRRAFLYHYRRHLQRVLTLTMPHHGSERNFHPDLLVAACNHPRSYSISSQISAQNR